MSEIIIPDNSIKTLNNIKSAIYRHPKDLKAYEDFFQFNRLVGTDDLKGNIKPTLENNLWVRNRLNELIRSKPDSDTVIKAVELMKRTYLYSAKDIFTDYMTYIEWDRKPKERFWLPRSKVLGKLANAMQMLVDDELDELFLSMPPRVGKTTMMLFFVTWIIGKDSEKSNLYSAFSDVITSAFYQGVLEVLSDPTTYAWGDVFDQKIAGTNAKDETLDIGRKKRYHSLVARSLYGTLNGACDASGILISDDLIGGIEEALNKDRLISAWSKVDNNLIPRAKESCKLLWVGTRWSNSDPAGLRMNILQTDSRFKGHRYSIINLPALNEKGESNFEYDYGVGFSTKYYQMRKASFNKNNDDASWLHSIWDNRSKDQAPCLRVRK